MTTLFTIGHGNRSIADFLSLLAEARIECVVDVRAYPASRRHPQFVREALMQSLLEAGIVYRWEGATMGGRRRPAQNSPHVALRNASFRAYADHMMRPEFRDALNDLMALGAARRAAIVCAERLPWQCHRYLIADALSLRGVAVKHLIGPAQTRMHALNPAARGEGELLIYDVTAQRELDL